jgi:protein-tyrosine phosphatase
VLDYQTPPVAASCRVEPLLRFSKPLVGRSVASQLLRVRNLATQRQPSSSRSCPDLSSLRISHQIAETADPDTPIHSAGEFAESVSCSSSSETGHQSRSGKLASTSKRASRKARSVLGRFRAFRRKAVAKMAQSSIRVDINVHGTKRGYSQEDDGEPDSLSAVEQDPGTRGGHPDLPPFLNLSPSG